MSVSSSSADDGVTEEINIGTDSSYGSQKRGEEVQRRRTMQTTELTPIRAAILGGRVGRRRTNDGVGVDGRDMGSSDENDGSDDENGAPTTMKISGSDDEHGAPKDKQGGSDDENGAPTKVSGSDDEHGAPTTALLKRSI